MAIFFQCPLCGKELKSNDLECSTHGQCAQNELGFITFLEGDAEYFSDHWSIHRMSDLPLAKIETATRFIKPLEALNPRNVLDIGTGDGVHLSLLKKMHPKADLAGIDISAAALASCHQRVPDATLMLADAESIPLQDDTMDATFSFGVLAYLPNPWHALSEMVRVTRSGGIIGLWIFPRTRGVAGALFSLTRKLAPMLPRQIQRAVADCIVPALGLLPTASGMHLGNSSWAACRELVLVNIAPPLLSFPTREEVLMRITELGCDPLWEDDSLPLTVWARKG